MSGKNYPKSLPVGFYEIYDRKIEDCIKRAISIAKRDQTIVKFNFGMIEMRISIFRNNVDKTDEQLLEYYLADYKKRIKE